MKTATLRVLLAMLVGGLGAETAHAVCDFGPDTCLAGFVWREAFPGDHVCVTGATRTATANDNGLATQRRSPTGGAFGPDTCLPGFVWREASPADHVCVTGATRAQAASDNAQAGARRDPQCASPPSDTSPPAFVQTTITFYRVPDGAQVGSAIVPPAGLTTSNVARDRRFVIATTAGDNESGISTIQAGMEMSWNCSHVLDNLAVNKHATLDSRPDEEKNGTAAPGNPLLRNAHFSLDPFDANPLRLVCPAKDDAGPLTVEATLFPRNGQGLTANSGPIIVVYGPRPHTGLALGEVCGDKTRGVVDVCTTGTTCGVRQRKVCSGWWIFSHCDYIQSTDMFCQ